MKLTLVRKCATPKGKLALIAGKFDEERERERAKFAKEIDILMGFRGRALLALP